MRLIKICQILECEYNKIQLNIRSNYLYYFILFILLMFAYK